MFPSAHAASVYWAKDELLDVYIGNQNLRWVEKSGKIMRFKVRQIEGQLCHFQALRLWTCY